MQPLAASVVIGLVAGLLSGAFGIGGGVITTPALRLLLGAPALIAVGTPLPVIVPSAVTGAYSYARAGLADVRAGLMLGLSGAVTAVVGALLAERVGGTVVLVATGAVVIWAATDIAMQAVVPPAAAGDASAAASATRSDAPARPRLLVGIGLLAGLYSGFLGLGGGFILVPMLTRFARFPLKAAIGTSLVGVTLLAVPGSVAHAVLGNVDWLLAAGMTVGVIPGAWAGSKVTQRASDRAVRVAFAIMLAIVGVYLIASELRGA